VLRPDYSNPAHYLRAYALAGAGDIVAASDAAKVIIAHKRNSTHVAHATRVLIQAAKLAEGRRGIGVYKQLVKQEGREPSELETLEEDAGKMEIGSISTGRPSDLLKQIVVEARRDGVTADHLTRMSQLILLHPEYRKIIATAGSLVFEAAGSPATANDSVDLLASLETICRTHISSLNRDVAQFPKATLAVLHATAARARCLRERSSEEGITSIAVCRADFEMALRLDPTNAYAQLWFAGFLRDTRADPGRAIELARSALSQKPRDPGFLLGLASCLVRCSPRAPEALAEARNLLSLSLIATDARLSETRKSLLSEIDLADPRNGMT